MTIRIIYSLLGSEEDATSILSSLISNNMVACGNIFPCHSHFEWGGNIQNEKEWVLIVKTSQKMAETVCKWIETHHPYEIPAILTWSAEANEKYGIWVEEQVRSA